MACTVAAASRRMPHVRLVHMFLARLGMRDTRQSRHAVLRIYCVIGHMRFCLEFIRPEMRQYFIEGANQ